MASGMSLAVTGPTLIDLQNIVKTDTKHIAFIYTARSNGYLFGSLFGGALFDLTARKQFVMTVFNFLICISMIAIPWSRRIEVLTAWMVLNGATLGAVDTGLNVCILNLWGKDNGPYYQALHFTYGFGGLIAPLIAAPFLESFSLQTSNLSNSSWANTSLQTSLEQSFQNTSLTSLTIPSVTYTYSIIACCAFLVTVLFFVMCIMAPFDDNGQQNETAQTIQRSFAFIALVFFLNFLLLFVDTGTEIGYAQMLATYAVKGPLKLSTIQGSYMTSTFWGAFTLSRFSSIFLAIRFSSLTLLISDIVITSIGAAFLFFFAPTQEWALWIATVLLGLGIASFFPAAVAWVEQYITVTNKIVAIFAIGGAFGEMVIPYTISHFIDEVPEVLTYVVIATCVLSAILTLILYFILSNTQVKYLKEENSCNATQTTISTIT